MGRFFKHGLNLNKIWQHKYGIISLQIKESCLSRMKQVGVNLLKAILRESIILNLIAKSGESKGRKHSCSAMGTTDKI